MRLRYFPRCARRFDAPSLDAMEPASVFTVGHSKRSTEAFVALLKAGRVDLVVDIRCTPRSRTNPQFNLDTLGQTAIARLDGTANGLLSLPRGTGR